MSNELMEVARLPKNTRETLVVGLQEFNGHKLLNARVFVGGDGAEKPTKSGLAIRVTQIRQLREALAQAEAKARELGWLTEG